MLHWAFISQLKKINVIIVLLNNSFFFCLFAFPQHTVYQNDYFSGKIKQKPFSEVIQFLYFICFATTYFKTT